MKIKVGLRGSSDSANHVIIKMDDLMLITADNLFLAGQENREKTGKSLVSLLDSLSKDHEISIGSNIVDDIEEELYLNGELQKYKINQT